VRAGALDLMAADNNNSTGEPGSSPVLDVLERIGLATLGAVALTAERADQLADELSKAGGMRRDEARDLIEQTTHRWRGEALRFSERAGAGLEGLFHQLGLVSRADFEELELRVAQLEHRLRLVEDEPPRTVEPQE
jgi:polyhydroxyalkanoate synthesis regulator phasin